MRWQDPEGRKTLNSIVKKVIPRWTTGLRRVQEDIIAPILDGEHVLGCTATGDGKSAACSVPILVLNEYNTNPQLYPRDLPTRLNPVGIVVTPTKGLASNIVSELTKLGIKALAYSQETLAEARRNGVNLADKIKNCEWQVICVNPEHLSSNEWRIISGNSTFRARLSYACVDEVHLIFEWGANFRIAFKLIGLFFRGRLPSHISIVGLSATLAPGRPMTTICDSLGFYANSFHFIHNTNERPNVQFILQPLTHGISGYNFPDLLPFLRSGRKTIIHCSTIDLVFRVYIYIWRLQPSSADKFRRTRMYHSLCPSTYNEETLRLIEDDPYCQIVIATIAFANGINARGLLDSISLGFSSTLDILWQEKGRVGREPGTQARGVVLVQPSTLVAASKQIAGTASTSKGNTSSMDNGKALLLTEKKCLISCINKHYANPPVETSTLDCITAKRSLPCSTCLPRADINLEFEPSPGATDLPQLTGTLSTIKPTGSKKKNKLKNKEKKIVSAALTKFRNTLCVEQHRLGNLMDHPQTLFLPSSIQSLISDQLLTLHSRDAFDSALASWRHHLAHGSKLYLIVVKLRDDLLATRATARAARNAARRKKRAGKKRMEEAEDEDEDELEIVDDGDNEVEEEVGVEENEDVETSAEANSGSNLEDGGTAAPQTRTQTQPPPKRKALEPVTNMPKPKKPRAATLSVAEATQEYGPGYKTNRRRA